MALLDAYATLAEYKAEYNLTASTWDTEITAALLGRSRVAEKLLGVAAGYFNTHSATYVFDGHGESVLWLRDRSGVGYCLTAITADNCSIDTNLDGTADYTLDLADAWLRGLPENAAGLSEPFTALELLPHTTATITKWPDLPASISITGTWGWAAVPHQINQFTLKLVRDLRDMQTGGATQQVRDIDGVPIPLSDDTFRHFMAIAGLYGRRDWSF